MTVKTEDAYAAARQLARLEGIFAGISSGAALAAALTYAASLTEPKKEKKEKKEKIVIILPDTGERYLSTDLWASE